MNAIAHDDGEPTDAVRPFVQRRRRRTRFLTTGERVCLVSVARVRVIDGARDDSIRARAASTYDSFRSSMRG